MPKIYVVLFLATLAQVKADEILINSFTGEISGGFTSIVLGPTGLRIEFLTQQCPHFPCSNLSNYEYAMKPGLFVSTGLIFPASKEQVFVAHENDPSFSSIASIITERTSVLAKSDPLMLSKSNPAVLSGRQQMGPWRGDVGHPRCPRPARDHAPSVADGSVPIHE